MDKLFSIAFSILILAQSINVNLNDIMQVDELLGHYQLHAEEYGDNLLVFVSKHYGELKKEHTDENQEEHEKLPFQELTNMASSLVFIFDHKHFFKQKTDYTAYTDAFFYYNSSKSSFHNKGIFQPPREA